MSSLPTGDYNLPLSNEAFRLASWLFPQLAPHVGSLNLDTATDAYRVLGALVTQFIPSETSITSMESKAVGMASGRTLTGYLALVAYSCYHVLAYERYGQTKLAEAGLTRLVTLIPQIASDLKGLAGQAPNPNREYLIREAVSSLDLWYHSHTGGHLEQAVLDDIYVAWMNSRSAISQISREDMNRIHTHPLNEWARVVTIYTGGSLNPLLSEAANSAIFNAVGGIYKWPLTPKERLVSAVATAVTGLSFDRQGVSIRLEHVHVEARLDGSTMTVTVSGDATLDIPTINGVQIMLYQVGMSGPKTTRFNNRGTATFRNVSSGNGRCYRLEVNVEG